MIPNAESTPREHALSYYDDFKWFVIPTDPGRKKPYYGFSYKERYGDNLPDRQEVSSWEEWNKDGVRVGTRTGAVSGIIVLDVDSREAHEYVKTRQHSICPMVQSPREGGGLHLYFKHPGFYVKSTVGLGGVDGLDIRGDWGIVVLPPSVDHHTGRGYEWTISPYETAIPDAPDWVLELLHQQSSFKEKFDPATVWEGIPEGKRDTELNRYAGKLRQLSVPEDSAIDLIEKAAERCKPPFNRAEAKAKVKWAYTYYEAGEEHVPILTVGKKNKDDGPETFTLSALMDEEFPPVRWAVRDLLPEGSMIFAGKPKMGKSWMALGMCIAVATGGRALGNYDVEVGDVLYLALEDQKRRLQGRAKELLESDVAGPLAPDRLEMRIRSKKLDAGLMQDLEEWLKGHPDARLIVIDTLGSVRGRGTDRRTLYEQDYEIGSALTSLAGEYAVTIVIVHHLRKGEAEDPMDMISGSTGLTGGLDGAMVLNRTRSASDGIIRAVHRDLEEDVEIALAKVPSTEGWWRYIGNAQEYMVSQEKRAILGVLADADDAMKPKDVAEEIGKTSRTVSKHLREMLEQGLVESQGYGLYVIGDETEAPARLSPPNTGGSGGSGGSSPYSSDTTSTESTTSTADEGLIEWEDE